MKGKMPVRMVDCRDRVRLSVSDETGVMRVKRFNIAGAPECGEFADRLREMLLGRPLHDIDPDEIRGMSCRGDGLCGRAVADIIVEYQGMVRGGTCSSR
jgi:hypothetical protein